MVWWVNRSLDPELSRCPTDQEREAKARAALARELGVSSTTISEILRNRWKGKTGDRHLACIHNWLELTARREGILHNKQFVTTAVAEEIILVARTVAETGRMGVVFGPSHIGKSFTLEAIEGD